MSAEITNSERWAIVELMGHVTIAGKIEEVTFGGAAMIRLDVPTGAGFATQMIGANAVYRIQFVDEITATAAAKLHTPSPPVSDYAILREIEARGITVVHPAKELSTPAPGGATEHDDPF